MMSLANGSRLGSYDILALLGIGGMGEVYRARDAKLGRDVAIKVLPATFTSDPERVARFRREAQVLASLNHPHIGAIYGLDDADGCQFLVLELVDGESLDKRIARGRIPIDEALAIAKQIAEALEAAHEKSIIHRDLKPANIVVTSDGNVKVLDFGLAKAVDTTGGSSLDVTNSPTITTPAMMTGVGMVLGTAAYMSPEQAKGKPADRRSDVWAFGCVLYEMLTAKRAFAGEDVSDTLAAVLRGEPDWSALPTNLAESGRLMLLRCLEKDRSKRLSDISIARFLMTEQVLEPRPVTTDVRPPASAWWKRLAPLAAFAFIGATAIGIWVFRPATPSRMVTRLTYPIPEDQRFTNQGRGYVALSPDGTRMAYVANQRLYVKTMWDPQATPISATQAGGVTTPVFSPNGEWVAYWSSPGTLNKIAISGGAPVKLCEIDNPFGITWDGDRLFVGAGPKGIFRVPDKGGPPELIIRVRENEVAHGPELLPDGRSILFTLATGTAPNRWDTAQIVVQAIGSTERKIIVNGGADARYLETGHIVYALGGVLFAERFDVRKLEAVGGPIPVVEGVARTPAAQTGSAQFAVSATGSLAYLPGPATTGLAGSVLALSDRKGIVDRLKLPPQNYQSPRFSPNGQQLAVGIEDGRSVNIWVHDFGGGQAIRQLTFGGQNRFPIWTRDGTRVTFQSDRDGTAAIYWQRADGKGTAELLVKPDRGEAYTPNSWSPDSDTLLFSARSASGQFSLRTFTLRDKKTALFAAVESATLQPGGEFSRDGRWVVYQTNGPTLRESTYDFGSIYVRPFPPTDELHLIGPGINPFWAPDGKGLYYVLSPGANDFSFVTVTTTPTFGVSEASFVPRPAGLSGGGPGLPRAYDIAPDNMHFVVAVPPVQPGSGSASHQIDFVLNWVDELKARVPNK